MNQVVRFAVIALKKLDLLFNPSEKVIASGDFKICQKTFFPQTSVIKIENGRLIERRSKILIYRHNAFSSIISKSTVINVVDADGNVIYVP